MIGSLSVGGTELQLIEFLRHASDRFEHRVAVLESNNPLADRISSPLLELSALGGLVGATSAPVWLWRARRVIGVLGPSIVHAHLAHAEMVAAACTPRGIPLVASRRGMNASFGRSRFLRWALGLAHLRTRILLCNSRFVAEHVAREDFLPPRTTVIYNGIDLSRFSPLPFPERSAPTVAVIANLRRGKGHDLLLAATGLLLERHPRLRVLLVGSGKEEPDLRSLVAELRLGDTVEFCGAVSEVRPLIARSHLVALTSEHEGFPNALLEAMAMGRPVVTTDVGGVPELISDGVEGYIVARDPSAVAEAMDGILSSASLQETMGADARRKASNFRWERTVEETEAVYEQVIQGP